MTRKVLITDYVHPSLVDGFSHKGFEVHYERDISYDQVQKIISQYEGVVINSKVKMTEEVIKKAANLKFIARLGSGLEIVDLAFAESQNVAVINSPEGNRNAVAEHALGMLLALSNKLISSHENVRSKKWNREAHRGFEISGKNIGIIGLGHTGTSFAEKFAGWGVKIFAHDKYLKEKPPHLDHINLVSLNELLEKSEIISFHLPLTEETKYYCNDAFLAKCRDEVIIMNTSRGGVVNLEHLLNAITTKKLKGACLDVFENEKPATYTETERIMYERLFNMDNVILSPHVAGWTNESLERISQVILKKLESIMLL